MSRKSLERLSVAELISLYIDNGLREYAALDRFNTREYNSICDLTWAIEDELQSRLGDRRRELLDLYTHPNLQVRLNAAKATRSIAPDQCRAQLQEISDLQWNPQSLDAGMALHAWDEGIWKPD